MDKQEGFEWAKIPPEYDRRFIFKVVASQATETDHTKDANLPTSERVVRVYSNEERKIAARSLSLRHIDIDHDLKRIIPEALVLDAQWVEPNKIECICYIPDEKILNQIRAGFYKNVSIEETNREDVPLGNNRVDMRGITYFGLALVTPDFQAGDPLTSINPLYEGFSHLEAKFEFMVKAESEKEPVKEPIKEPVPPKEPIIEKKVEERVKELEEAITRLQKETSEAHKKQLEQFEKGKKEGRIEVIKSIEKVIPSVLVQRQGSVPFNRLCTDLKKKLREESQ